MACGVNHRTSPYSRNGTYTSRRSAPPKPLDWPGLVGRATVEAVCESPVSTVAVTWYAPTVVEKMDTTVEELRAALETAPGIFM